MSWTKVKFLFMSGFGFIREFFMNLLGGFRIIVLFFKGNPTHFHTTIKPDPRQKFNEGLSNKCEVDADYCEHKSDKPCSHNNLRFFPSTLLEIQVERRHREELSSQELLTQHLEH